MDDEFDIWFNDERGTGELELESDADEVEYDSYDDPKEDY